MSGSELVVRVEGAGVGSRELDAEVCCAFEPAWRAGKGIQTGAMISRGTMKSAPLVTTSLDAALALASRVLPGVSVGMTYHQPTQDDQGICDLWLHRGEGNLASVSARNPALALCAAILRAHEAGQ